MTKSRGRGCAWRSLALGAVAVLAVAGVAHAQLLGGLPRSVLPSAPSIPSVAASLDEASDQALSGAREIAGPSLDLRQRAMRALVRAHPETLDTDPRGQPVVRGEILALSPSDHALQAAAAAGFSILRRARLEPLALDLVVLQAPAGLSTRAALARVRRLDAHGAYDFDHVYSGSGRPASPITAAAPAQRPANLAGGVRMGLVDTGVAVEHPAFAAARIEQRGFAPGGVRPAAHGTAVASLMVGQDGRFRGAAPGGRLYAADVYGAGPAGGSAEAITRALAWMAQNRVPVINVSLVGPPNLALQAAVQAVLTQGEAIVAPVGNDGPAAPPLYPAAYPGVIAVTAVDDRGRILFEAGRGPHLDFAAPGADIVAASPDGGFASVRGTSFAAPIVAARLALLVRGPGRATMVRAQDALARSANHNSRAYGRGLVGADLRLGLK